MDPLPHQRSWPRPQEDSAQPGCRTGTSAPLPPSFHPFPLHPTSWIQAGECQRLVSEPAGHVVISYFWTVSPRHNPTPISQCVRYIKHEGLSSFFAKSTHSELHLQYQSTPVGAGQCPSHENLGEVPFSPEFTSSF